MALIRIGCTPSTILVGAPVVFTRAISHARSLFAVCFSHARFLFAFWFSLVGYRDSNRESPFPIIMIAASVVMFSRANSHTRYLFATHTQCAHRAPTRTSQARLRASCAMRARPPTSPALRTAQCATVCGAWHPLYFCCVAHYSCHPIFFLCFF